VVPLVDKFLGGMIGCALGDAIGELAFSYRTEADLRAKVAQSTFLRYTDDTAMAIGLAQSLVACGQIDEQHLGDTFRANYQREPWRGYASGPPTVFATVDRYGISYSQAAQSLFGGEGSYGNGAAMRIVSVALYYHDATDIYEQVRRSASVTHAHPVGVDGAAVLAWAIAQAVTLDPGASFSREELAQGLVWFARTEEMRAKMRLVESLLGEEVSAREAARRLGQSVAAHESVPFAIYAFLRHPTAFDACLYCAALHSGDRDTVGAMACAVSGAYLGIEGIPQEWQDRIEHGLLLAELGRGLWVRKQGMQEEAGAV
jgi:poly(ADP-ribose) glycohydrolase ARH3